MLFLSTMKYTITSFTGKADPPVPYRLYFHNEIPVNDAHLSKQLCSFEKLKLTNNSLDRHGHVSFYCKISSKGNPWVFPYVVSHCRTYIFMFPMLFAAFTPTQRVSQRNEILTQSNTIYAFAYHACMMCNVRSWTHPPLDW